MTKLGQFGAERWQSRVGRFWRDWKWFLATILTVIAFGLGVWGAFWYRCDMAAADPDTKWAGATWSDIFYLALQLFVINATLDPGPKNIPFVIAQFLAPLVTVFMALMALLAVYHEQFQVLWMRIFFRRHALVCGTGLNVLQLIKDLTKRRQVVVIEEDEEDDLVPAARDCGAVVLIGDPTDGRSLLKARADRAAQLFALRQDDLANLVIAAGAASLQRRGGEPLNAHVHVSNLILWNHCRRHEFVPEQDRTSRVQLFNMYATAARLALHQYPLDPDGFGPQDSRSVHLVILGLGHMGESVAVQALKIGHFANLRPLRITIVDREAGKRREVFATRYPQAHLAGQVEYVECDVEGERVRDHLQEWSRDAAQILNLAVCLDDDSKSLGVGMELAEMLNWRDIPIRIRMEQRPGPLTFQAQRAPRSRQLSGLCVFGMIEQVCTEQNIVNAELDRLARAIHADFLEKNPGRMRPWDEIDEETREFNREQADHIAVKLRAINCYAAEKPEDPADQLVTSFDELAAVQPLAIMEHRRWCAGHYLAGWKWAEIRNDDKKEHWCLVDWTELPKVDAKAIEAGRKKPGDRSFQENDRDAVRNIFRLLAMVGRRVYRRAAPPAAADASANSPPQYEHPPAARRP